MYMFRNRRDRRGVIALIAVSALALAACGGDDDTASTTATTPTTAEAAAGTTIPEGTVDVTLADVSANSMLLTPSPKSAPAGTVTFVVTNAGTKDHEFVVLKTDIPAADLPIDEATDKTDEEGEGVENVGEIGNIKAGETKTIELDLESGHYDLICNLKGHLRMGMWSDFDVT